MSSMNVAVLMGHLTRTPELRQTPGGQSVCEFRIAVNEVYTNRDGEKAEQTLFIDIATWDKQAESCAKFLAKGSLVVVEGRLRLDQWTSDDGQKRSRTFIRAGRVQFMGRPRSDGGEAIPAEKEAVPF